MNPRRPPCTKPSTPRTNASRTQSSTSGNRPQGAAGASSRRERRPAGGGARGVVVARALQLAEAEQARAAATRDRPVGVRAGIGGEECDGQLALELGDLVAERATGGDLVGFDNGRQDSGRRGRLLLGPCDLLFQK